MFVVGTVFGRLLIRLRDQVAYANQEEGREKDCLNLIFAVRWLYYVFFGKLWDSA